MTDRDVIENRVLPIHKRQALYRLALRGYITDGALLLVKRPSKEDRTWVRSKITDDKPAEHILNGVAPLLASVRGLRTRLTRVEGVYETPDRYPARVRLVKLKPEKFLAGEVRTRYPRGLWLRECYWYSVLERFPDARAYLYLKMLANGEQSATTPTPVVFKNGRGDTVALAVPFYTHERPTLVGRRK